MIMQRLILVLLLMLSSLGRLSAATLLTKYNAAQLDSLLRTKSRNIVVFLYTDWCRFCRAMEQTTFRNESVINGLNEKFYFVVLNAEEKAEIIFNGQKFNYKPTGANTGVHELGEKIGRVKGQVSYPSVCVLNAHGEIMARHAGFISSTDLLSILNATKAK